MHRHTAGQTVHHEAPDTDFAEQVVNGLRTRPRAIPCRFLYDERGSQLFEEITQLEEYYPTRTEIALLQAHAEEISDLAGDDVAIVEFGSGSSRKTEILLRALPDLRAYVAIDISPSALASAAARLRRKFPSLEIIPVSADFNEPVSLPRAAQARTRLGFFPGSTIGNLDAGEARKFLSHAGALLGNGSALLLGVDLKKDPAILIPAYDDREGVTAAFNLNLLRRINRELDGSFDISQFAHEVSYNEAAGRVEIYITSLVAQNVEVLGQTFAFRAHERIHTENSHKYTIEEVAVLAHESGWQAHRSWVDEAGLFSLHYLTR